MGTRENNDKLAIQEIASKLELDVKSVERLVCSCKVKAEDKELDLGLRLIGGDAPPLKDLEFIAQMVQRYRQTCSVVVMKIISPEFKSSELVSSVSLVSLTHACRTAGRLRAMTLKRFNNK